MKLKKAISPVVAIALLLVVSVVAVVGFQNWYAGFQSGLLVDTEQRSSSAAGGVNVEFISSDGILYVTNTGTSNVSMSTIKIGDIDCDINYNLSPGVNNISIVSCLSDSGTNDVMLVTEDGIIEEEVFVEEMSENLDETTSSICDNLNGGEWVLVPGNVDLGTSDFCVMKYEAKFLNVSGKTQHNSYKIWSYNTATGIMNITSSPSSEPIAYITQTQSKTACENLGNGYHLITNAEWTTIARNAELIPQNWNSSMVGIGNMYKGHSDGEPLLALNVSDENNYYDGTNQIINSDQRRTLILSNQKVIWDLSGNIQEWNNDTCIQNSPWETGVGSWLEWDDIQFQGVNQEKYLAGPIGDYNYTNGIGRYYGCTSTGNVFCRGSSWNGQTTAGAFGLILNNGPFAINFNFGFRCAYTPQ